MLFRSPAVEPERERVRDRGRGRGALGQAPRAHGHVVGLAVVLDDLSGRLGAQQREQRRDLLTVTRLAETPLTLGNVTDGKKSLRSIFTMTFEPIWREALVKIERPPMNPCAAPWTGSRSAISRRIQR